MILSSLFCLYYASIPHFSGQRRSINITMPTTIHAPDKIAGNVFKENHPPTINNQGVTFIILLLSISSEDRGTGSCLMAKAGVLFPYLCLSNAPTGGARHLSPIMFLMFDFRLPPPCKAYLKQVWLCSCFVRRFMINGEWFLYQKHKPIRMRVSSDGSVPLNYTFLKFFAVRQAILTSCSLMLISSPY